MWETKPYRQTDNRWRGVYLGWSTDYTIGSHGCLITSLAMLLTAFGHEETPLSVNQRLKSLPLNEGFAEARLVWRAPERLWPVRLVHVAYQRRMPADTPRIARYLERAPVLIEVEPRAGQYHWVLALGATSVNALGVPADLFIRDPLYRGITTLLTRYRVKGVKPRTDPLQLAITAYAAYEPAQPIQPESTARRAGSDSGGAAIADA